MRAETPKKRKKITASFANNKISPTPKIRRNENKSDAKQGTDEIRRGGWWCWEMIRPIPLRSCAVDGIIIIFKNSKEKHFHRKARSVENELSKGEKK